MLCGLALTFTQYWHILYPMMVFGPSMWVGKMLLGERQTGMLSGDCEKRRNKWSSSSGLQRLVREGVTSFTEESPAFFYAE